MKSFPRLLFLVLAVLLSGRPVFSHEGANARIAHLSREIQSDPINPSLFLQRGEAYRRTGDWTAAGDDYAAASSLGADPGSVAQCRAALALDRGEPGAALDALARVPDTAGAAVFRLRGRAYSGLGFPARAAACFRQVVDASDRPRPQDFLDLARAHFDAGSAGASLAALDSGIALLGPVPSLVYGAVDLELAAEGSPDAALARLAAMDGSPANLARRGDVLAAAGRSLAAQAAYTEALERLLALPPSRRAAPGFRALEDRLRASLSVTASPFPEPGGRP